MRVCAAGDSWVTLDFKNLIPAGSPRELVLAPRYLKQTCVAASFPRFAPHLQDNISESQYRGTSLIRNSEPLGPCNMTMPRAL